VDDTIVALAETFVRYRDCASIQQLFTTTNMRRRGFARSLVSQLMQAEAAETTCWTWLAAADNEPSIGLALSLGFRPSCEFGFVEGS
jgi:predicted GNAT family acetyltransferase